MKGGQNENPGARAAQPGQGNRYAEAAGTSKIAQSKNGAKRAGLYEIHPEGGGESFTIEAGGREAWALDRLTEAGPRGCTPIEQPAPRWSAYVHRLRGFGVPIETIHEPHGGAFAGTHGRYVLRARVVKGSGGEGGCGVTKLQILYLRRCHGLTEAQAHALAALVWGAGT